MKHAVENTNPRALLDAALAELELDATEFTPGEFGIGFTVTRGEHPQRVQITWSLLKICRNIESVKRAILHQLEEKVG